MTFLYLKPPPLLEFKWLFEHLWLAAGAFARGLKRDKAMRQHHDLGELNERLRKAGEANVPLMDEVIAAACRRYRWPGQSEKTSHVEQLIWSGGWTDAALALIDLELPLWHVRRITYDGGEWHCALSRQRELPEWLDQCIEVRHADLALAILSAFVEARRVSEAASRTSVPTARRSMWDFYEPLPLDNFL